MKNKATLISVAVVIALLSGACKPAPAEPEVDLAALRQDIQKKTERMYWIHLRLDTAATDVNSTDVSG